MADDLECGRCVGICGAICAKEGCDSVLCIDCIGDKKKYCTSHFSSVKIVNDLVCGRCDGIYGAICAKEGCDTVLCIDCRGDKKVYCAKCVGMCIRCEEEFDIDRLSQCGSKSHPDDQDGIGRAILFCNGCIVYCIGCRKHVCHKCIMTHYSKYPNPNVSTLLQGLCVECDAMESESESGSDIWGNRCVRECFFCKRHTFKVIRWHIPSECISTVDLDGFVNVCGECYEKLCIFVKHSIDNPHDLGTNTADTEQRKGKKNTSKQQE